MKRFRIGLVEESGGKWVLYKDVDALREKDRAKIEALEYELAAAKKQLNETLEIHRKAVAKQKEVFSFEVPPAEPVRIDPERTETEPTRKLAQHFLGREFIWVDEIAELCRVSRSTVRYWIKIGKLKSARPGLRRIVRRQDLEEFLKLGSEVHPVEDATTDKEVGTCSTAGCGRPRRPCSDLCWSCWQLDEQVKLGQKLLPTSRKPTR